MRRRPSATKSQLDCVTRMLERYMPPRANLELLPDGSFLVTLYRYELLPDRRVQTPWLMRRLNRRGSTVREAVKRDDEAAWGEYTHGNGFPPLQPYPRTDTEVEAWMRKDPPLV